MKKPTKKLIRALHNEVPAIAKKIPVNMTAVAVVLKHSGAEIIKRMEEEGKPAKIDGKPIDPKAVYTSTEWKFEKIDHSRKLHQFVKAHGERAVEEYMAFLRHNKAKMERMFPAQFGPKETKHPIPEGQMSMQEIAESGEVKMKFAKGERVYPAPADPLLAVDEMIDGISEDAPEELNEAAKKTRAVIGKAAKLIEDLNHLAHEGAAEDKTIIGIDTAGGPDYSVEATMMDGKVVKTKKPRKRKVIGDPTN